MMSTSKLNIQLDHRVVAWLLIVIILISYIYYKTITSLVVVWDTHPDYSHGFFIPFISLYMIWNVKDRLELSTSSAVYWGLLLLIAGVLLQVAGAVSSELFLQGVSLIIVLWGGTLYLGGTKIAKELAIPVGYLMFMVPLPGIIWNRFSFLMKLQATNIAVFLLNSTVSMPLMQEGNIIHLTGGSLEVADACSGLRSLISMLALGVLIAFISRYSLWKKIALVVLTIPIAIAANIGRLILMVILADHYGISVAESFIHTYSGILVFIISLIILMGVHMLFMGNERQSNEGTNC